MVILLIERRPLERRDASKTKVMESVGESETFLDLEISIGVPLATWTNLIGEGIRESSKEEWLVIWSVDLKSITQVLDVAEFNVKPELLS